MVYDKIYKKMKKGVAKETRMPIIRRTASDTVTCYPLRD